LSTKNWLKFVFLGLIWGSSFLWIKIAAQELNPFVLVNLRVGFAVLGLVFVIVFSRTRIQLDLRTCLIFGLLGLFNVALPFVLISWAEGHISSGLASILNSTTPLFTMLIAPLAIKDDRFSLQKLGGVLVGFCGVIILMSNQLGGGMSLHLLGIFAMLLAALCYAISTVFARRMTTGMGAYAQAFAQMMFALIWITPTALTVVQPYHLPALPISWVAVAWLGLLGSCVATILYYSLLHSVGPTRTMMTNYIFPLIGVLLGVAFLGEHLDWNQLAGGILIIGGIILVNTRIGRLQNVTETI
jgi:drug/metabolite transporter (DMT)-like permease